MAVAPHVDVRDHRARNAKVGEGRHANPGQLRELIEHLGVTVAGWILVIEDGDHQSLPFPLDQQARVEVDGERHALPRQRRARDGAVQRVRPDRQLQSEGPHEVGRPVAGADDHSLGFHHIWPDEAPGRAGALQRADLPVLAKADAA